MTPSVAERATALPFAGLARGSLPVARQRLPAPRAVVRRSPVRRPTTARGSSLIRTSQHSSSRYSSGRSSGQSRYTRRPSGGPRSSAPRPSARAVSALEAAFAAAPVAENVDTTWQALGLNQRLVTGLERREITKPFPIQAVTFVDAAAGRDVLGRARTGSGKTLAFGLPLLSRLATLREVSGPLPGHPRGLILVPTRELAVQVQDALQPLAHGVRLRTLAVFGGASIGRQISALERGVDLVVATPGRLQDLIDRGACSLAEVEVTAIDEADHMSDLGFLPVVVKLLELTRPDGQRLLFSATLDGAVSTLVERFLKDPALHAVASAEASVDTMDHRGFVVRDTEEKMAVLTEIAARPARTILFVRTKHGADRLATRLTRAGVDAAAIHGDLRQNARQRALDSFAAGRTRVLVATDVAARGIHVDDVDLVIHVDPPNDHKDYLHRSGRTARAGASGLVLSVLVPGERRTVEQIWRRAGVTAELVHVSPGSDAVRAVAESGEPVVVVPEPVREERPRTSSGRSGYGRGRSESRGYDRPRGERGSDRARHPESGRPDRGPARPRRSAGRPAGEPGAAHS
nr:DEAD/DEAH box helicase [Motilibacter aurantiacus]